MIGNGNISLRCFSLDHNGSLYSHGTEKSNVSQVINGHMDNILQKDAVALLKNDEVVATALARKNYDINDNDLLDFYFTDKLSKDMTFSDREVMIGRKITQGCFSFNIDGERKIRYGESRGLVDYTKSTIKIIEDNLYKISSEEQTNDIMGLCESGSNYKLCRLKNGTLWHEKTFKESLDLGRKLDEDFRINPQAVV